MTNTNYLYMNEFTLCSYNTLKNDGTCLFVKNNNNIIQCKCIENNDIKLYLKGTHVISVIGIVVIWYIIMYGPI